jgi:hypothetical protein
LCAIAGKLIIGKLFIIDDKASTARNTRNQSTFAYLDCSVQALVIFETLSAMAGCSAEHHLLFAACPEW